MQNLIKNIDGNVITLENQFVYSYKIEDRPVLIRVRLAENVSVKSISVTSKDKKATKGIEARLSRNLTVADLTVKGIQNAIFVTDSIAPRIISNTITDNGRAVRGQAGLQIFNCLEAEIRENKLKRSGAIWIRNNINSRIIRNTSDNTRPTNGDGISVVNTVNCIFDSNTILNANCYGIWIKNDSRNNTISNNRFSKGITSGIYLTHGAQENLISNNITSNNAGNGIFVAAEADRNIIRDNLVERNQGRGILVHGKQNTLSGNTALKNGIEQIKIQPGNFIK